MTSTITGIPANRSAHPCGIMSVLRLFSIAAPVFLVLASPAGDLSPHIKEMWPFCIGLPG